VPAPRRSERPARTLAAGWSDLGATYDAVAADYAAEFAAELDGKPFDRQLLSALAERLRPGAVVADVGCGPAAQIGAYLASLGPRVVGLDLSPVCAAAAPLPSVAGSLLALPLAGLDAVVCFYALIHIPRTLVPQALSSLRSTLQPGGELLLAVHSGTGEFHRRGFLGHEVAFDATMFERSELHGLLAAAGFCDVRVARRQPYPQEHPTERLYASARA
jgi:SAM-dependent methyltransferase